MSSRLPTTSAPNTPIKLQEVHPSYVTVEVGMDVKNSLTGKTSPITLKRELHFKVEDDLGFFLQSCIEDLNRARKEWELQTNAEHCPNPQGN